MPYEPHEEFNLPPASARVWRYVSLTKLLSMLETATLFFSRVDLLGDPWEGSVSSNTIKAEQTHNQGIADLLVNTARVPPDNADQFRWQVSAERLAMFRRNMRAVSYASCWHVGAGESAAMWSQSGRTDAGLAIQSTVGRLLDSITDQERVFAGAVTYTDYEESTFTPRTTLLRPLLLKRYSFAHEHELRCLVSKLDANFGRAMASTKTRCRQAFALRWTSTSSSSACTSRPCFQLGCVKPSIRWFAGTNYRRPWSNRPSTRNPSSRLIWHRSLSGIVVPSTRAVSSIAASKGQTGRA